MIFISYSRKDTVFAQKLTTSLENLHVEIWIDREDIPAGMKWSTAIQQGLSSADIMLVILSPDSTASHNVEDEWQYYLDRGKTVIPILLRPTEIHFQLSRIQYVDFFNQTFEAAFSQLQVELKRKGVTFPTPTAGVNTAFLTAKPLANTPFVHGPTLPAPVAKAKSKSLPFWLLGGLVVVVGVILLGMVASSMLSATKIQETAIVPATAVAFNTLPPIIITATPLPNPTSVPTTAPSSTPLPTATVQPAPDQAVRDYYQALNDRLYTNTWNTLSDVFKKKFNVSKKTGEISYSEYVAWWDSVALVSMDTVSTYAYMGDTATVYISVSYLLKDGRDIADTSPYVHLIFEQSSGKWLFQDKTQNP